MGNLIYDPTPLSSYCKFRNFPETIGILALLVFSFLFKGSGGGMLSLWREGVEELEHLQSQVMAGV